MSMSDIILFALAAYIGANSMALIWIGLGVILGTWETKCIPDPIKEIAKS